MTKQTSQLVLQMPLLIWSFLNLDSAKKTVWTKCEVQLMGIFTLQVHTPKRKITSVSCRLDRGCVVLKKNPREQSSNFYIIYIYTFTCRIFCCKCIKNSGLWHRDVWINSDSESIPIQFSIFCEFWVEPKTGEAEVNWLWIESGLCWIESELNLSNVKSKRIESELGTGL